MKERPTGEKGSSSFKTFAPFIHTEGLTRTRTHSFRSLLQTLFEETGELWAIDDDTAAPTLAEHTKDIAQRSGLVNAQVTLMAHRTYPSRTWIKLDTSDQLSFAIDPAGVLNLDPESWKVLPYFGLISQCPFRWSKDIYTYSKPVLPQ